MDAAPSTGLLSTTIKLTVRVVDHPAGGEADRAVLGPRPDPRDPLHGAPRHHPQVGGRSAGEDRQALPGKTKTKTRRQKQLLSSPLGLGSFIFYFFVFSAGGCVEELRD